MMKSSNKTERRKNRVRSKIKGTAQVPRLSVFRSHQHIYAQLIDDSRQHTLVSASDQNLKTDDGQHKTKKQVAYQVGLLLAERALESDIDRVIFDRGPYKYHGRVRALAEGAREGGLQF